MNEPYTPGPWKYKTTPGSDHEYCTVYAENGRAIARHVLPENACVIAAAPELLTACEAMVHAVKMNDPSMGLVAATLSSNAITKAGSTEGCKDLLKIAKEWK